MSCRHSNSDSRAVSPVVGVVILLGFVVFVGVGLFIFAQSIIVADDPRVDADFELVFSSNESFDLVYEQGTVFSSDNTHELYVIGENSNGDQIQQVMVYQDGDVQTISERTPELTEGMTALTQDDIIVPDSEDNTLGSGSSLQVVWEPKSDPGTQIVVDEIIVPDESSIEQQVSEGGTLEGNIEIDINIG